MKSDTKTVNGTIDFQEKFIEIEKECGKVYELINGNPIVKIIDSKSRQKIVENIRRVIEKYIKDKIKIYENVFLHIDDDIYRPEIVIDVKPCLSNIQVGFEFKVFIETIYTKNGIFSIKDRLSQYLSLEDMNYYVVVGVDERKMFVWERKQENLNLGIWSEEKDIIEIGDNIKFPLNEVYESVVF